MRNYKITGDGMYKRLMQGLLVLALINLQLGAGIRDQLKKLKSHLRGVKPSRKGRNTISLLGPVASTETFYGINPLCRAAQKISEEFSDTDEEEASQDEHDTLERLEELEEMVEPAHIRSMAPGELYVFFLDAAEIVGGFEGNPSRSDLNRRAEACMVKFFSGIISRT